MDMVCLMLLSGLFTPVRSMPYWAYLTTFINPKLNGAWPILYIYRKTKIR